MNLSVIGVDMAVDPRNCAVASAVLKVSGGRDRATLSLCDVRMGSATASPAALITTMVAAAGGAHAAGSGVHLLCIDAPIGWPSGLAAALTAHQAGFPLSGRPDDLFRRSTDRDVRRRLGKQPLDVGADRIARTAHAALGVVENLRREGAVVEVPLSAAEIAASARPTPNGALVFRLLETYPAAWWASECIDARGYRQLPARRQREALLDRIEERRDAAVALAVVGDGELRDRVVQRADALDAVLCSILGAEAYLGLAPEPPQPDVARREGWIWCKSRVETRAHHEPVAADVNRTVT